MHSTHVCFLCGLQWQVQSTLKEEALSCWSNHVQILSWTVWPCIWCCPHYIQWLISHQDADGTLSSEKACPLSKHKGIPRSSTDRIRSLSPINVMKPQRTFPCVRMCSYTPREQLPSSPADNAQITVWNKASYFRSIHQQMSLNRCTQVAHRLHTGCTQVAILRRNNKANLEASKQWMYQ